MDPIVEQLRKRAQESTFRIAATQKNQETRAKQEQNMKACKVAIERLDKGIAIYRAILNAISDYSDEKRKDGNAAVIAAMRAASFIVPSCDASIIPKCEEGEAWFETEDGIEVSRLEGGGYRSILSCLMRSVVLRSNPQFLQTLVLDEIFAKLSVENSATLSGYLPILAQDMQIITIEQKPEVTAKTPHVTYKFHLDGDRTTVQREDVSYGEVG